MLRVRKVRPADRRGATIVETAFVLPVFFLFVFAIMEFGHATMVSNVLKNSCRNAARWGAASGATTDEVADYARNQMKSAVNLDAVTLQIKDASFFDDGGVLPADSDEWAALPDIELSEAETRQMFLVRATVRYGDVTIFPQPWLADVVLGGQAITRHE
ncbi:pilus assembly protein [Blastopirellula sp. JC732]|uniref:Pilus assembly protein n=1 Tax=Blastopirellula sediminis TaxID=2894196 RepID=A0A9X1MMP3_9BACT|nr:TadE family protein [Blastopirellula sediminis]MCC9607238.1 pilus assembly protein [Blastopirellula sediminis]MCC9629469.1 pilus assembly protein [Blastopirellula sediminis]